MKRFFLALALVGGLAACQSSEERAEKHYQSAVTLIAEGDVDRGLVELRNVFKLNGLHRDARALYARTVRAKGDLKEAYSQYLRLAEQHPDDPEANLALAEIVLLGAQPEGAARFTQALRDAGVDTPEAQAAMIATDYAQGVKRQDRSAMGAAAQKAAQLLQSDPGQLLARRVTVAQAISDQDWGAARREVEAGMDGLSAELKAKQNLQAEQWMMLRRLGEMHLSILNTLGDKPAIEVELKRMIGWFRDDKSLQATLVRWYMSEQRPDDAEAWLRERVTGAGTDPEPRASLVQFLVETKGREAALDELDAALAAQPVPEDISANQTLFRGQRAGLIYDLRDPAEGMAETRDLIAEGEKGGAPADQLDRLRITLARMEDAQGNRVGARQLVETVLSRDAGNIDALKLKGGWQVEADQTGDALVTLRAALGAAPDDAEIMTLLARAYEREGSRELMADMLSRAVAASRNGARESVLYAQYLVSEQKLRAAETVLIDALKVAPSDVSVLAALGRVHVAMQDWPRAEQDIARLRELGGQGAAVADELQARSFAGQNRIDDLTAFLEQRPAGNSRVGAESAVIRASLLAGRIDDALERSKQLLEELPDDPAAKFVRATVLALSGQDDEAATLLQETVQAQPKMAAAWTSLAAVEMRRNNPEAAGQALDKAMLELPESQQIKAAKATYLEQTGDLEGAITIYDALYAEDSNQLLIANNLASLLTTARDDDESLERAYTIARRLRGLVQPAMQDTYGWIAFRRGDIEEAKASLEPAAAGLARNPQVQYHLGRLYAATGNLDGARAQYEKARQLIPEGQQKYLLEQIETAVTALDAPAAGAGDGTGSGAASGGSTGGTAQPGVAPEVPKVGQ